MSGPPRVLPIVQPISSDHRWPNEAEVGFLLLSYVIVYTEKYLKLHDWNCITQTGEAQCHKATANVELSVLITLT